MNVSYSVVIPAYNEQIWLPRTLHSVRTSMDSLGTTGEVIVVDNNSTDDTARIAAQYGANVVFEPVNQISRARNRGGRTAQGEYLIFLDADTLLSEALLKAAVTKLSGDRWCGGGVVVDFGETVPPVVRLGMNLWNRISKSFDIAAGCFIFCLKRGFDAVGGFSENVYASEEFWYSRKLKAWGEKRDLAFRVISDPPIITSPRKLQWFSPLELMLILFLGAFPFAVRSRALCAFWYRRPPDDPQR